MSWYYQNQLFTENDIQEHIAFVYLITNINTNKKYIGKKSFYFQKILKVNGKRKRIKIPSDWNDYYGSNKILKEEVELKGSENFKREILYLCRSKAESSYLELREQIDRRVLESEEYYNEYIMVRVNKNHLQKFLETS